MKLRTNTQHGDYAGFVSRGFAFAIDAVIIALSVAGTSWLVTAVLNSLIVDPLRCPEVQGWADLRAIICQYAHVPAPIAAIVYPIVYRIFFWWTAERTPGMAAMGLQLVRLDAKPMTFFAALKRLVGYAASLLVGGLGFLSILVSDRRQGLHDRIAGTVVLYAWPAREDPALARALAKATFMGNRPPDDAVSKIE